MSNRRRKTIFAIALLIIIVVILLDRNGIRFLNPPGCQTNRQSNSALDVEKYHSKTFTVINVVDGDTIDIDSPDGQYNHTRIRLWGLDTPETKNPKTGLMYFGPQASEFTKKLTLEKKVQLFLNDNKTRDLYGRLLAYVKLPNDKFLNELLLIKGFAYSDLRFRHGLYNKYKQLESVARSQKKGLWQNVTREQLPTWLQREKPNLLKQK